MKLNVKLLHGILSRKLSIKIPKEASVADPVEVCIEHFTEDHRDLYKCVCMFSPKIFTDFPRFPRNTCLHIDCLINIWTILYRRLHTNKRLYRSLHRNCFWSHYRSIHSSFQRLVHISLHSSLYRKFNKTLYKTGVLFIEVSIEINTEFFTDVFI